MARGARSVVLGLLLVTLLAAAWTAVALLQARGELARANDALVEAAAAEGDEDAAGELLEAQRLMESVADRMRAPGPRLVSWLPLVGRTVDAVRVTADAAAAVAEGASGVVRALPDDLVTDASVDVVALERVEVELRRAAVVSQGPLSRLRHLELWGTPGVVATPVRQVQQELAGTSDRLAGAADALSAVRLLLGSERERRLLIVVQNNAELRATGGLVSVFATATAERGALRIEAFREVDDVAAAPSAAQPVDAPPDYRALFGPFKAGTTLWKNVNMAADVPTSSSVLAEIAGASLGAAPDAIVWLDVPAVAAVLQATGPVALPDGSTLDADGAVPRLLSQAYDEAEDSLDGQQRRQELLRAAADAVVAQLLDGQGPATPRALATNLSRAAAGRHLALWSADAEEQELLQEVGLAGEVAAGDGDLSSFAVHNLGDGQAFGNKLDYYARRLVKVYVEVGQRSALVEQTVAVRNTAPASGLPFYVAGRASPGVANDFITFAVPAGGVIEAFERDDEPLRPSPQPLHDHQVLTDVASVMPGQTVTWRVQYRVPVEDGRYRLRLFPQPLAVDAGLNVTVVPADGARLAGDPVQMSGPFRETLLIEVDAEPPSRVARVRERLKRFWNEPVRLP